MDPDAVLTLRANRDWRVLEERGRPKRIEDVTTPELLRTGGLGDGEAALLVGGPPCQPFSKASYWHSGDSRRLKDPRANTLEHFLRVLRDALPEAFLLEN